MTSEWPIRSDARRPAPPVAPRPLDRFAAYARRLEDATVDLFLDPAHRVSDQVRALASAMRDGLVETVERDMRLALGDRLAAYEELAASLSSASVTIALPLLTDTRTLSHPPLAAILIRRAEEWVLAARIVPPGSEAPALLIADADPGISEAAMALLVATSRRRDRFGAPVLLLDDCDAELAHWLVWRIAAALRHYLRAYHAFAEPQADALLTEAATAALAEHDEGRGLHAIAARLGNRLSAAERIDGSLLETLLSAGQIPAFVAALATAVRLPHDEIWAIVAEPGEGRLPTLLRALDIARDQAAAILLTLNEADAGSAMDQFEATDRDAARQAISPLGLPRDYRDAIAAIGTALAGTQG